MTTDSPTPENPEKKTPNVLQLATAQSQLTTNETIAEQLRVLADQIQNSKDVYITAYLISTHPDSFSVTPFGEPQRTSEFAGLLEMVKFHSIAGEAGLITR